LTQELAAEQRSDLTEGPEVCGKTPEAVRAVSIAE